MLDDRRTLADTSPATLVQIHAVCVGLRLDSIDPLDEFEHDSRARVAGVGDLEKATPGMRPAGDLDGRRARPSVEPGATNPTKAVISDHCAGSRWFRARENRDAALAAETPLRILSAAFVRAPGGWAAMGVQHRHLDPIKCQIAIA